MTTILSQKVLFQLLWATVSRVSNKTNTYLEFVVLELILTSMGFLPLFLAPLAAGLAMLALLGCWGGHSLLSFI